MSDANRTQVRYLKESTWGNISADVTPVNASIQIAAAATVNTYHNSAGAFDITDANGIKVGDYITVTGFGTGANNTTCKILSFSTTSVANDTITVDATLATEAEGNAVTFTRNPRFTNTRITSESLNYAINTTTSQELRSDRQISDLVQTDASASGDLSFEFSANTFDEFLMGVLYYDNAAWPTETTLGGVAQTDISFTNATGVINWVTGGFSAALSAGDLIHISGATNTGNNGWAVVSEVTDDNNIIVENLTLTDELAGASITITYNCHIYNGTTERSYTIERAHEDINQWFAFKGMIANQLSLNIASGSIVTGSFSFMGSETTLTQEPYSCGAGTAAPTTTVMNAVTNVANIYEGGTTTTSGCFCQSLDFTINNNVRALNSIGSLYACDMGAGTISVDGNMQLYFVDETAYNKFLNNTATSLMFTLEDSAGNSYAVSIPEIKFSTASVNASGINQDVMQATGFTAILDPDFSYTIAIGKKAA